MVSIALKRLTDRGLVIDNGKKPKENSSKSINVNTLFIERVE